jgi:uncharacterized protein YbbK (DUF523 family)
LVIHVLVSACLLGEKVRYNGAAASTNDAVLAKWLEEGRVVSFCPEVAGGLGVPRPAAEILDGDGDAVLATRALVMTREGTDLTTNFLAGAHNALAAAQSRGVRLAILKDGSPSCGSTWTYDGTFTGQRQHARGVTAALLERNGIRVFSDEQIAEAAAYLRELEDGA